MLLLLGGGKLPGDDSAISLPAVVQTFASLQVLVLVIIITPHHHYRFLGLCKYSVVNTLEDGVRQVRLASGQIFLAQTSITSSKLFFLEAIVIMLYAFI